jgi:hypothetical protein
MIIYRKKRQSTQKAANPSIKQEFFNKAKLAQE